MRLKDRPKKHPSSAASSHYRPRRWHPVPHLPPMPRSYARLYDKALRRQHRFFASKEGHRNHIPLARNRAIWALRDWLMWYREGDHKPDVIHGIADCMATITVLSSRD